ncbi:MAG: GAF domain-containing protein [Halobacteriovoraceae bacterium]|jgi:putative methionine-R-sulfoxide reductase with GAF domain|nr:GAF domain-containing protein [Halobacteriovoraceae bacterium]MBT5094641.1 GAF domain-containing protein [Halobacteriovoraceae bacterium]
MSVLNKEQYFLKIEAWLKEAKALQPNVCDWIGIYFKASWLDQEDSTDLVLGPFIGEPTDHIRISIDRGFCGMALREERTINIADVREEEVHIACSLKTRSELVLPLADSSGDFIAELDIDSNTLGAFTPKIEEKFQEFASTFPLP